MKKLKKHIIKTTPMNIPLLLDEKRGIPIDPNVKVEVKDFLLSMFEDLDESDKKKITKALEKLIKKNNRISK